MKYKQLSDILKLDPNVTLKFETLAGYSDEVLREGSLHNDEWGLAAKAYLLNFKGIDFQNPEKELDMALNELGIDKKDLFWVINAKDLFSKHQGRLEVLEAIEIATSDSID